MRSWIDLSGEVVPIRALHPVISSLCTQFSALALELDERLDTLGQRVVHDVGRCLPLSRWIILWG